MRDAVCETAHASATANTVKAARARAARARRCDPHLQSALESIVRNAGGVAAPVDYADSVIAATTGACGRD